MKREEGILFEDGFSSTKGVKKTIAPTIRQAQCNIKTDAPPPHDMGPALVPSMREIEAIEPNGFRVVSTFSGCGGSCLGFRMAGFKPVFASEFIPAAQDTYRANNPETHLDTRDIRLLTAEDIFEVTGLCRGECDVLEGSPPCASFSTAGKREAGWGTIKAYSDTKQRTDDLFFEFARILDGVQPRVFVAENVKGLMIGKARGYLKEILAALRGCGYRVKCAVLDAQFFGVPQHRERLIFIGVRDDLGIEPTFPKPQGKPIPLKAVLPHIAASTSNSAHKPTIKPASQPASTILAQGPSDKSGTAIDRYAIGDEWEKLKPGEQSEKYFQLVKADPRKPAPTVMQGSGGGIKSAAGLCHPFEKRKFTIPELRRICGFPDDFVLTGTFAQQWERLGRAVPPPMMAAVARHIRDNILLQSASDTP